MGFLRKKNRKKTAETLTPAEKTEKTSDDIGELTTGTDKEVNHTGSSVKREEFHDAVFTNFLEAAQNQKEKNPTESEAEILSRDKTEDIPMPEKKKKNKKKAKARENRRSPLKIARRILILPGVLSLGCAGIYTYGCLSVSYDTIARNVYIEDIDVSGLTAEEAIEKLQNESLLSSHEITLTCNSYSYTVNCAEAGLTAKTEDTAEKALRYGKSGDIFLDGLENTLLIFRRHTIIPDAEADEELLRSRITEFGNTVYGELTEHRLEAGDGIIICTPGHSGFDGNTDPAYTQILNAIKNDEYTIPVTLNAGSPRRLSADDVNSFIYRDPADACYKKENGEIIVSDEVYGRYIDIPQTEELLSLLCEGGDVVYIPYYTSYPNVTADQLREKLFSAVIASYSTGYGTSPANRCANITNAAGKINETVLMPGEVFSFNDTVGPRSAANGFYTAKEYVGGETVDGIGGGTCQVSSTLYNAVLYSDLSIVSRTNHMFPVGYCPTGQDATVADTGVDFKFVNSMNDPIKISAQTSGYTVTVSIIGTQRDDPRTVKIENTTTMVGEDQSVHSVRYVYNSAGELIQTDDLGNSYYMAHNP